MPTLGQHFLALRGRIQHRGWRAITASLIPNLYRLESVSRWRLDLASFDGAAVPPGIVVRQDHAALDSLRRQSPEQLPEDFFVDRVCGVSRFYLGLRQGQVGHISWVFSPADPTPDIDLGPREVEIRYVHTLREHRRCGLSRAVLAAMLSDLKAEGLGAVYAHILRGNDPSERLFASLGFVRVAFVTHRRILGFRLRRIQALS
jgi:ribosomal protein S18 acetylase RimI-like enzyme